MEADMSWAVSMKMDWGEGELNQDWNKALLDTVELFAECLKEKRRGADDSTGEVGKDWPEFAIYQGPWDYTLERYDEKRAKEALPASSEGRFFGVEAELRWQLRPRQLWAVFICDFECGSCNVLDPQRKKWSVPRRERVRICSNYEVVLWGEERAGNGAWREGRIPRELVYPLNGAGVPVMEVRLYEKCDRGAPSRSPEDPVMGVKERSLENEKPICRINRMVGIRLKEV
jgi:hypothetical protein